MLKRLVPHLAPLPLVVVVGGFPVAAQQLSPQWTRCVNQRKAFSPEVQVSGCTAVLQSDGETTGNRAIAYYGRGYAHQVKRDNDRAIADYSEAIRLKPRYADAYYARGLAYHAKGDKGPALADFSQAIRLRPNDTDACYSRGFTYHSTGDYDRAVTDFSQAIRLRPGYATRGGSALHPAAPSPKGRPPIGGPLQPTARRATSPHRCNTG